MGGYSSLRKLYGSCCRCPARPTKVHAPGCLAAAFRASAQVPLAALQVVDFHYHLHMVLQQPGTLAPGTVAQTLMQIARGFLKESDTHLMFDNFAQKYSHLKVGRQQQGYSAPALLLADDLDRLATPAEGAEGPGADDVLLAVRDLNLKPSNFFTWQPRAARIPELNELCQSEFVRVDRKDGADCYVIRCCDAERRPHEIRVPLASFVPCAPFDNKNLFVASRFLMVQLQVYVQRYLLQSRKLFNYVPRAEPVLVLDAVVLRQPEPGRRRLLFRRFSYKLRDGQPVHQLLPLVPHGEAERRMVLALLEGRLRGEPRVGVSCDSDVLVMALLLAPFFALADGVMAPRGSPESALATLVGKALDSCSAATDTTGSLLIFKDRHDPDSARPGPVAMRLVDFARASLERGTSASLPPPGAAVPKHKVERAIAGLVGLSAPQAVAQAVRWRAPCREHEPPRKRRAPDSPEEIDAEPSVEELQHEYRAVLARLEREARDPARVFQLLRQEGVSKKLQARLAALALDDTSLLPPPPLPVDEPRDPYPSFAQHFGFLHCLTRSDFHAGLSKVSFANIAAAWRAHSDRMAGALRDITARFGDPTAGYALEFDLARWEWLVALAQISGRKTASVKVLQKWMREASPAPKPKVPAIKALGDSDFAFAMSELEPDLARLLARARADGLPLASHDDVRRHVRQSVWVALYMGPGILLRTQCMIDPATLIGGQSLFGFDDGNAPLCPTDVAEEAIAAWGAEPAAFLARADVSVDRALGHAEWALGWATCPNPP